MTRLLGKLEPKIDARTLKLANYLDETRLPTPGASKDWSPAVRKRWTMGKNDELPCCTTTALAHAVQSWTANDGRLVTIPDAEIVAAFKKLDPTLSRGAYMLDACKLFRREGIGGHRCLAFVEINMRSPLQLMRGTELFGGVYVGLRLPNTAKHEKVWHDTGGILNSWGGHAAFFVGHGTGVRRCVTWQEEQLATDDWLEWCADEGYCFVSEDWTGSDRVAPNGFALDTLLADLAVVTQ